MASNEHRAAAFELVFQESLGIKRICLPLEISVTLFLLT